MKEYKYILLDLDGTITNTQSSILFHFWSSFMLSI